MELSDTGRRVFLGEKGPPPAPAAAVRGPTPVFVLLGHGRENLVAPGDRPIIPPNTFLVTVVECSIISPVDRPGKLLEYLHAHPDQANNPIRFKADIERGVGFRIRIYIPGDRYPDLMYNPFSVQTNTNKIYLSGIVPLNRVEDRHVDLMKNGHVMTSAETKQQVIERSFEISVEPTIPFILARDPAMLSRYESSVKSVMELLGPGVYYAPICRAVPLGTDPARIRLVREYSSGIQGTRGAKRSTKGYRTRRDRRKRTSIGGKRVRTRKRMVADSTTRRRRFLY